MNGIDTTAEILGRLMTLEQTVSHLTTALGALVGNAGKPPIAPATTRTVPPVHDPMTETKLIEKNRVDVLPWPSRNRVTVEPARENRKTAISPTTPREIPEVERLATIGRLMSGVAHDVNNLLTVICGYAELLAEGIPSSDPRHDAACTVSQLGHQAAELIRYINEFRNQSGQSFPSRINELLERLSKMLPRFVGRQIKFSMELGADAGYIRLAPAELLQLVLNLLGNARDATPEHGSISLRTAHHTLVNDRMGWPDIVPAGKYAILAVSDTGKGMDDHIRTQMFESGFTTREDSGGSGIGLSTVRELVERVSGYIQVQTVVDWGTTIRVFFPAIE